ncbi:hypothetical protein R1flu_010291 [Riccia fluitans]|uniref:Uncharacterized protein n=1 Tax=Riccia fluitans TaxID=41844 RepID=A0ABD1Z4K4_9MARC
MEASPTEVGQNARDARLVNPAIHLDCTPSIALPTVTMRPSHNTTAEERNPIAGAPLEMQNTGDAHSKFNTNELSNSTIYRETEQGSKDTYPKGLDPPQPLFPQGDSKVASKVLLFSGFTREADPKERTIRPTTLADLPIPPNENTQELGNSRGAGGSSRLTQEVQLKTGES